MVPPLTLFLGLSFLVAYAKSVILTELCERFSHPVGLWRNHVLSGFPLLHDSSEFTWGPQGMSALIVCPVEGIDANVNC